MNYFKRSLAMCLSGILLASIVQPVIVLADKTSYHETVLTDSIDTTIEQPESNNDSIDDTSEPTPVVDFVENTAEKETDLSNNPVDTYTEKIESTLQITDEQGNPCPDAYERSKMGSIIVTTFKQNGNYRITGTAGTEVAEKITLSDGFIGSITLNNVQLFYNNIGSIDYKHQSPIEVASDAQATIYLEGDNSIRAPQYFAAIEFSGNVTGNLVIDSKTDGYLRALGGGGDAAAIGGIASLVEQGRQNTANIEIRGGQIKADSFGVGGAAIGSAAKGNVDNIVISGGEVTAISNGSSSGGGAAIGSGERGTASNIKISGGIITADATSSFNSNGRAAAIGSGIYGELKNLEISGGYIKTITGKGVGVGAGYSYSSTPVEEIKITGGTITTQKKNFENGYTGIGVTNSDMTITNMIVDGGNIITGGFSQNPTNSNQEELAQLLIAHPNTIEVIIDGKNQDLYRIPQNDLSFYLTKQDHILEITNIDGQTRVYKVRWGNMGFENLIEIPQKKENKWLQIPSIEGWKYGEQANTPVAKAEFGDVVFTYSNERNGIYSNNIPNTVGTWYLKASVAESENYTGLEEIVPFTIQKGETTIIINDILDRVFDGTPSVEPSNLEIQGSNNKPAFTWHQKIGDSWKVLDIAPSNAGVYKIVVTVLEDENYNRGTVEKQFTISKVKNSWEIVPSIEGWKYGEQANTPVARAEFGDVVFTYSNERDGVYSNNIPNIVGTWYLKASVAGNENYTGLEEVIPFTIEKGETSIIIEGNLNRVFDGKPSVKPKITVKGSTQQADFKWYQKNSGEWKLLEDAPSNVGQHKVVVEVASDGNYEGKIAEKEFSISIAENSWEEKPNIQGWKYGENPNVPKGRAKFGEIVFRYSNDEKGEYTTEVPKSVGRWYLKATVTGSENYTGLEEVIPFTIEKGETSITVKDNLSRPYSGESSDKFVDIEVLGSHTPIVYSWYRKTENQWEKINFAPVSAGSYKMVAEILPDENYNGSVIEKEFTISKAKNPPPQVSIVPDWIENGEPVLPIIHSKFGTPVYTYSNQKDGVYTLAVPKAPGVWYMKISVAGTEDYEGWEQIISFNIKHSNAPQPTAPPPENVTSAPTDTTSKPDIPSTSDSDYIVLVFVMAVMVAVSGIAYYKKSKL